MLMLTAHALITLTRSLLAALLDPTATAPRARNLRLCNLQYGGMPLNRL
jgi:hypothetical protein